MGAKWTAPDRGLKRTATITKSLRDLKIHSGFRPICLLSIALLLLSCGFCAAEQIRVSVQYIEVTHAALTEMLAGKDKGGSAMHAKALELCKSGGAKILETSVVVGRTGQRATLESIREFIYPTEYEPTCRGLFGPELEISQRPTLRPNEFTAFEIRNTGVTLGVEPTIGDDDRFIELRFVPEIISLTGFDNWMDHVDKWGSDSYLTPRFETWRVNTSVTLRDGQFEMVSVISPKPNKPPPAVPRKILVFVRADVITLPP